MREMLWQHVFTFEKLGYSKGVLLALIAPTLIMTFALLFDLLRRMAFKAILKVLRLYP